MTKIPDPYDGEPYYCEVCGAGYGDWIACRLLECKLEHEAVAHERKLKRQRELKKLRELELNVRPKRKRT